jgi:sialidase-1
MFRFHCLSQIMSRFLLLFVLCIASAGAESFESATPGALSAWESPVGKWSAADGQAVILKGKGKTGSQSLRLMGGPDRELSLGFDAPTTGEMLLSLHVERWTVRKPFKFRIDAKGDGDWVEIHNADEAVKVGGFRTEIRLPLKAGTREIRFRCDSDQDGGVLIDDVLLHKPGPARAVQVETVQPVCPAFIREDFNPVLGFKITVEGSDGTVPLEGIQLGFAGTSRMQDLSSFRILTGSADPTDRSGIRIGEGTEISDRIALITKHRLPAGEHWFWISPILKPDASLDGRIDAGLMAVKLGGQILKPAVSSPDGSQRIGYAIRLPGDDGSKSYRIPGIAKSKAGTLIAVYDIRYRHAGDLPADVDVGVSRSTDGGNSWEPMIIAMDMGNDPKFGFDGVGDPAVLADPETGRIWLVALWSHGNRGWNGSGPGMSPEETGQLMICHSDDDGLTWSKPVNLTGQLKHPEWRLFFNGPGNGIAMKNGNLVFAAQYRAADGVPWSTLIASKDGGKTWSVGSGVKSDTTEAQLVELADGSIMINCRDNRGGSRTVAVTKDLGMTWQPHATDRKALREPVCMASLVAWNHPEYNHMLWFSNPDTTRGRHSMTLKVSKDQGMTWPDQYHRLYDSRTGFGYSCITPVDEKHIGVIYEGINTMYYLRLPLIDWFPTGKDEPKKEDGNH